MSNPTSITTVVVLLLGLSTVQVFAQPRVQFDVSRTVACQVLSGEGRQEIQPGERLIQVRISVSLLTIHGEAQDVDECLYRLESASGATQVVDYLPRTTMDSSVEGNIRVQRNNEKSSQLNLNVRGGFEVVQANGGGAATEASRAALEYELIPPQEAVAAVGTTRRGTGVYFKLRRTPQTSLEGSRDFLVTLRVPANWRGGYFRAYCHAVQRTPRATYDVGSGTFVVPLYLAGDLTAKRLAENLSSFEQRLHAVAAKNRIEVHRRSLPTIAHELSLVEPKIPRTWFEQVLDHRSSTGNGLAFEARLPAELQRSIEEYRLARRALMELAGRGMPAPSLVMVRRPATDPTSNRQPTLAGADEWRARSK